jgi:hypothetical protein
VQEQASISRIIGFKLLPLVVAIPLWFIRMDLQFSLAVLAFGLMLLELLNWKLKLTEDDGQSRNIELKIQGREIFLEGLLAVIAGLAFTEAIRNTVDPIKVPLGNITNNDGSGLGAVLSVLIDHSYLPVNLIAFFSVAVPFYHGGFIAFLGPLGKNRRDGVISSYLIFIIVFANAVLLFLAAVNIAHSLSMTFFIVSLLFLNSAWLPIQLLISRFKEKQTPLSCGDTTDYSKSKIPKLLIPALNWIVLDLLLAVFLFWQASPLIKSDSDFSSSLVLLVVLLSRAAIDYHLNWKSVYSNTIDLKKA